MCFFPLLLVFTSLSALCQPTLNDESVLKKICTHWAKNKSCLYAKLCLVANHQRIQPCLRTWLVWIPSDLVKLYFKIYVTLLCSHKSCNWQTRCSF